jgi:hypothetical protein
MLCLSVRANIAFEVACGFEVLQASFVSTGLARSQAYSGWMATAHFQSGWGLKCAFVLGRPGMKTGSERKLASLFLVSMAQNRIGHPTIRIQLVPGLGMSDKHGSTRSWAGRNLLRY